MNEEAVPPGPEDQDRAEATRLAAASTCDPLLVDPASEIGVPPAICNGIGGILGARLAIAKGNRFIRVFFLVIICGTLMRFGYDVFFR